MSVLLPRPYRTDCIGFKTEILTSGLEIKTKNAYLVLQTTDQNKMESTLREYNSARKRNLGVLSPTLGNTCHTYYYTTTHSNTKNVNNRRFTELFNGLPHPFTDRNETRTWSSLLP